MTVAPVIAHCPVGSWPSLLGNAIITRGEVEVNRKQAEAENGYQHNGEESIQRNALQAIRRQDQAGFDG